MGKAHIVRLSRVEVIRAQHLLHMKYAPSEIAEEIGLPNKDKVYQYIKAGCPHERDDGGRLWIVGTLFRQWARAHAKGNQTQRDKMPEGQAYCFRCRKRVTMKSIGVRPSNRYLELVTGTCAECGGNVNRARKRSAIDGQPG